MGATPKRKPVPTPLRDAAKPQPRPVSSITRRLNTAAIGPKLDELAQEFRRRVEPLREGLNNVLVAAGQDGDWVEALRTVGRMISPLVAERCQEVHDRFYGDSVTPEACLSEALCGMFRAASRSDWATSDASAEQLRAFLGSRNAPTPDPWLTDQLRTHLRRFLSFAQREVAPDFAAPARVVLGTIGMSLTENAAWHLERSGCVLRELTRLALGYWVDPTVDATHLDADGLLAPFGSVTPWRVPPSPGESVPVVGQIEVTPPLAGGAPVRHDPAPCPPDSEEILRRAPALASAGDIARALGYVEGKKSLGNLLGRYRVSHPDCAESVSANGDRRPREPDYLYRTADVVEVIRRWICRRQQRPPTNG